MYYVQYAHARICSVLKQAGSIRAEVRPDTLAPALSQASEQGLMQKLSDYQEVIVSACKKQAPHLLVNYLKELAQKFHRYYNETQFLVESDELRQARLQLIQSTRQVLANGLTILGVSAPDKM